MITEKKILLKIIRTLNYKKIANSTTTKFHLSF